MQNWLSENEILTAFIPRRLLPPEPVHDGYIIQAVQTAIRVAVPSCMQWMIPSGLDAGQTDRPASGASVDAAAAHLMGL